MINTAIEELVNMLSPEYNKKAGLIKDVAAGAVLIAAIVSIIIGVIIFLPKMIKLIN
jgi:diacylglycerol kinase